MHPVASACTTYVASSSRKSRAAATMRAWSRSDPAPGSTWPIGALRVPTYAPTTPTTMIAAITRPMTRYPACPPTASRITGAVAPASMIVKARITTRQVISRAPVVRRGDLGGHGHVRHLEERARRRRGQEEHQHPRGFEHPRPEVGGGEDQRERHGQRQAGPQQPGSAGSAGVLGAVADAARDRVQHDVPGLGQQHDQARGEGGDAEAVGQVRQHIRPGTVPNAPVATDPDP